MRQPCRGPVVFRGPYAAVVISVLLPIKSFAGKARLADILDDVGRSALIEESLATVLGSLDPNRTRPAIITDDGEVTEWATERGVDTHPDAGDGLSASIAAHVGRESASGALWLVVLPDLPQADAGSMATVLGAVESGRPVLVPSYDGGTNLIGGGPVPRFAYGPLSFHRHLGDLARHDPIVLALPRLMMDVDRPGDLAQKTHP